MISYWSSVIFTAVEYVSQHFIFANVLIILLVGVTCHIAVFTSNNNYTIIYNNIKACYNRIRFDAN